MKKNLQIKIFGIIVIFASLMAFTACNSVKPKTISTTIITEAADDIVFVPAGIEVYRAQINPPNQFGTIQTTSTTLGNNNANTIQVNYRKYIESKAGETRNNIIYITQNNVINNAILTVIDLPNGITVNIDPGSYNSNFQPGWEQIIEINISSNLSPGYYNFHIALMVNGINYGQIPCTINVL